jgi:hypothetical protein
MWPSGAKYDGKFNKKKSLFSLERPNLKINFKIIKIGTWRFDKKSGTGRFVYADGDVYEGFFLVNCTCNF